MHCGHLLSVSLSSAGEKKICTQLLEACGVMTIPGRQALQTLVCPGYSDDGTSHAGL